MAKLTLADVSNLMGSPTAAANTINSNSSLIESALENTLSRDGTTPNQMNADLDMNHNDIINVDVLSTEELWINGSPVTPSGVAVLPVVFVANRTLLKAIDTTKIVSVFLTEVPREGQFNWRLGDYSAQVAADIQNGVYIKADAIPATTGAWVRAEAHRYEASWFGLQSTQTASVNTTALQAAVNLAALYKKELLLPSGTFPLNAKISWNGGLSLIGNGMGQTILSWTNTGSTNAGLAGFLQTSYDFVLLKDLTLETYGFTTNRTAFTLDGTAQILSGNIQDRYSPRFVCQDVYVRGHDIFSDGWDLGYDFTSILNANFVRPYVVGKLNGNTYTYQSAFGIRCGGSGNPCVITVEQPVMTAITTAIQTNDVEGLVVMNQTLVAVQFGIVFNNSNPSDLQPQLTVKDGHINHSGAGILVNSGWAISITGNFISGISDTPRTTSGVILRGSSAGFNICQNTFENTSTAFSQSGVVIESGTAGTINENTFANQATAIWLTSGSSKVRVGADNVNTVDPLGGNVAWILDQGTDNEINNKTFTKSIVPTLVGGSTIELVQVSVPSKIFNGKPDHAFLTDSGGSQFLVSVYDHDNAGTTATNIRFFVSRRDGGNITAGPQRLGFTAIGN